MPFFRNYIPTDISCYRTPHLPLTMHPSRYYRDSHNTHMTHPQQSIINPRIYPGQSICNYNPWECTECTYINKGSPAGRGPCIMCMHDDLLRIKVEVEDAGASPSPAPKITGTAVKTKALMSDVASLKAFAEAITVVSAAVAAAAAESAVAAAASTMMGMMVGGGCDDSGKPRVQNHTLISAMDIVEASGAFMDRKIVGSQVEVVGIGESQRGRSCNKHCICGLQLHEGSYVCFCKTRFAWRGGDEEDVLEVFHLDSGIMGCKVGYLPKHLAARADRCNGLCACIVEIYSSNHTHCASIAKCQKYHRGVGCCMATIEGMRDMFAIA
jgi:hypothetical protein